MERDLRCFGRYLAWRWTRPRIPAGHQWRGREVKRIVRTATVHERVFVAIVAALLLWAAPATSAPTLKKCRPRYAGSAPNSLAVVDVRTTGASCSTAKFVARHARAHRSVDRDGNVWACRVTRKATGSDPGFYPYTDVSCRRGRRALVRFRWSS